MALMSTQTTGLPPGIFECSVEQWKKIRRVTLPAFTNSKLRMVSFIKLLVTFFFPIDIIMSYMQHTSLFLFALPNLDLILAL